MKNTVNYRGITVSTDTLKKANLTDVVILETMPELVVLRNRRMTAIETMKTLHGLERIMQELYDILVEEFSFCECDDGDDGKEALTEYVEEKCPYIKEQLQILEDMGVCMGLIADSVFCDEVIYEG